MRPELSVGARPGVCALETDAGVPMTAGRATIHLERYLAGYMILRGLWLLAFTRSTDLSPAMARAMNPLSVEGWGSVYLVAGTASLAASLARRSRWQLVTSGTMIVILTWVIWSIFVQAPRSLLIPNSLGQIAGSMLVMMLHIQEEP